MSPSLCPAELTELYERYAPIVFRRAVSILGHEADAWDVTHEVFCRLTAKPGAFRGEARPMTYVYRITTNLALNTLRARRVRQAGGPGPGEASTLGGAGSAEARELLEALARELGERDLAIAALHFLDGLCQEDIVEVVGLSRKTVGRSLAFVRERARALAGRAEGSHG